MRRPKVAAAALASVILFAAALAPAAGADGQGMVMRALDEPVDLSITDAPIADALQQITGKTGVRVELSEDALAFLPHGSQTRLRLTAHNVRLRDALSAVLAPMSLQWQVGDSSVVVSPKDDLIRIARRPTFTEVNLLAKLREVRLTGDKPILDQLQQGTGVEDLSFLWHVDDAQKAEALERASHRLPCTAEEYVEAIAHSGGQSWTWYIWGTEIVILPQEMQAVRQLRTRVSLRYQNQPLLTVLMDLAQKAHLQLNMSPGVLNYLPAQTRSNFTLLMADASVDQALQAISGATGLEFTPGKMAVQVSASKALVDSTQPAEPARPRLSFMVTATVTAKDGQSYTVFMRPEELPPDLVKDIEARKLEVINRLRQSYGLELLQTLPNATTPPTQPAK